MIVLPRERPVFEGLNTYYLDMNKLLEHFRGSLGSGAVHLRSQDTEGVIFFDADDVLSAVHQNGEDEHTGQYAVREILSKSRSDDCPVNVYRIAQDKILYWANVFFARPVYKDLSSEFTDMQGLIKKQQEERLTGYITVRLGQEQAKIFFSSGELMGAAYSWTSNELNSSPQKLQEVLNRIRENGALMDVYQIAAPGGESEEQEDWTPEEAIEADDIYTMLEELLEKVEGAVSKSRSVKEDFSTLLRKKFLEKANMYPFLDPFAAELEYREGKIYNYGDVDETELVRGVVESAREIVEENRLEKKMGNDLLLWRNYYGNFLKELNVQF